MPRVQPGAYASQVMDDLSSGDEDGGNSPGYDQLGNSVLEHYVDACAQLGDAFETDAVFHTGVRRVKEHLSSTKNGVDCLICLGRIRPQEAVWSCAGGCFAMLHLVCIQDWAKNQQEAAGVRASSRLSPELFPQAASDAAATAQWHCPKCRHPYAASNVPRKYTCFCGKVVDPEWDPWLTPHSCGELCGRKLQGSCDHTCTLLCHPGPCPPCPRVIDAACYCEKKTVRRRCGNYEFSCERGCGRNLECGHECLEACHPGPCPPCPRQAKFRCPCGAEARTLPCSKRVFHCGRVCGKRLACGRHVCEQVCHAGACGGCPNEGVRTCPCGKMTLTGLQCDAKTPTCVDTCDKLLDCGRHHCQEKCHHGPCTKICRAMVTKECRCGESTRQVQCHAEIVCEKRCMNKRACGRHPCKRRCCDGNCPPCEEVCNRRLRCGHHKCPAPCHSGPCTPCPLTGTVTCACGQTQTTFICGREAQVIPPRCRLECPIPCTCRHASSHRSHRCHYGPCRPCTEPCGTTLPCGHTCGSATCHDSSPPPVPSFVTPKPPQLGSHHQGNARSQPATPPAPSLKIAQAAEQLRQHGPTACPPCNEPVKVTCVGEHMTKDVPCCQAAAFHCERECGRALACGHHVCTKPCHATAGKPHGEECQVCTRACMQPRTCPHPCSLPCHPDPCPSCTVTCRRPCLCGKATLSFPCHQNQLINSRLQSLQDSTAGPAQKHASKPASAKAKPAIPPADPLDVSALLSCGKPCHRQLPFCPHPCRTSCHVGKCPDPESCAEEVTVRCQCRTLKQKWKCSQVQATLERAGRGPAYDATAALRLLPCDDSCKTQAQPLKGADAEQASSDVGLMGSVASFKSRKKGGGFSGDAQQDEINVAEASGTSKGQTGSKRLSRQEREQLALQRQQERARQEFKKRVAKWLSRGALLLLCVLASAVLGLVLSSLLRTVDQHAAAKWKTE